MRDVDSEDAALITSPASGRRRLVCPVCRTSDVEADGDGQRCAGCGSRFPTLDGVQMLIAPHALGAVEIDQQRLYDRRGQEHPRALAVTLGSSPVMTLTYRRYCRMIRRLGIRQGATVLDIGCSTGGLLTEICATWKAHGVGVDLSPVSIAIAQESNPLGNEYYVASAEALPFSDEEFDHIVSLDVLEHTARADVAIREIHRCLKRGGTALFHVPVADTRFSLDWWYARLRPQAWARRMDAVGHDYGKMLSGRQLLAALRGAGFEVQRAERFNVLLQNAFDYHLIVIHRALGLLFQRGVRFRGRRHALAFAIYHGWIAPVAEWLTAPDRLLARAGIGASMYCLVRRALEC